MSLNPPRLMTLADLSPVQIHRLIAASRRLKKASSNVLPPRSFTKKHAGGRWPNIYQDGKPEGWSADSAPPQSLRGMSIALLFSKRSTRTRVSAETASKLLGGQALFLGKDDIQLGVNESARDTARVLGGMCQGIFARVGAHEEIEEIAKYSPVPVLNALSDLWHPTQVLADLMTLSETRSLWIDPNATGDNSLEVKKNQRLRPLTIAYVGDSANVLHDMLVTYPRLGHKLQIASPPKYRAPTAVWDKVVELECDKGITWTDDPKAAVQGADVVVTDTWISMGQEAEAAQRLSDFQGYQVTEALCKEGGANPDWKFLHCLPRKKNEVDDEVFYGPRSLVFQEADNRKWTIMALFHYMFGHWSLDQLPRLPKESKPKATKQA